jgi:acetyl esterase/lipase
MDFRQRLQVIAYVTTGALLVVASGLLVTALAAKGPPGYWRLPDGVVIERDIPFAEVDGRPLLLDVMIPATPADQPWPVAIFIHGGAWHAGDKSNGARYVLDLARAGYLGFSINYRLTQQAPFPAQIHDCKAAVRWVRAHAAEYGGDPNRIAVLGPSAGGHLATLLALSGGDAQLEGTVGDHLDVSSDVQVAANWFGPSDLRAGSEELQRWQRTVMRELLGALPEDVPEVAVAASPITYVDPGDPPLIIIHGDADPTVSVWQSQVLYRAASDAGVPTVYIEVPEGGHGQFRYTDPDHDELVARMIEFFDEQLSSGD